MESKVLGCFFVLLVLMAFFPESQSLNGYNQASRFILWSFNSIPSDLFTSIVHYMTSPWHEVVLRQHEKIIGLIAKKFQLTLVFFLSGQSISYWYVQSCSNFANLVCALPWNNQKLDLLWNAACLFHGILLFHLTNCNFLEKKNRCDKFQFCLAS